MRLIGRVHTVFKARGPLGLARFLVTRIARRQRDILFEKTLVSEKPATEALCLEPVVVIDQRNLNDAATASVAAQIFAGDNAEYRPGIEAGDIAFAYTEPGGQLVTYAFVLYRTFYKRLLGIPIDVPLIGNCFTVPAMRGRKLYPAMLGTVCRYLAQKGHDRVFISCSPDNQPSIRGIERAGFRRTKDIKNIVVLSKVVIARTEISIGNSR
jgi:RimJ/RimL family protein N-acetyltransferase